MKREGMMSKNYYAKEIEVLDPNDLVPYDKNPRKHSDKSTRELCRSIERNGFTNPIIIDQDNRIVAGHGRRKACLKLNMKKVPCVRLQLEEHEYLELVMSDNKIQELSSWDKKLMNEVALLLDDLQTAELEIPGFNDEEIDKIFGHSYKETLDTNADFGDSGEVDALDDEARVTSMTFKMTVPQHKKVKDVIGAVMRENEFETTGETLFYMASKFKGSSKTIRRQA